MSDYGLASFESATIPQERPILSGLQPLPVSEDLDVGPNTDWPAGAVVRLGAGDILELAQSGAPAIGVTLARVRTGAGQSTKVATLRIGCVDPEALYWHASLDTPEERREAFRGAPAPTAIIVQPVL